MDIDIGKLIEQEEEFEKEEIPKMMNEYHCKYCGDKSTNLEIKKNKSIVKELKKCQEIVDKHNENIKKKSDKKWTIDLCAGLIVVREEGRESWIDSYSIDFNGCRLAYVTCPTFRSRNFFTIYENWYKDGDSKIKNVN